MQGLHLTADLYRCRCEAAWLTDAGRLGPWCVEAVEAAGLQPLGQLFRDSPATGGVTATVLLDGSHLCLHTQPRERVVVLDVYVGDAGAQRVQARALMDALVQRFAPEWTEQRSLDRGDGE